MSNGFVVLMGMGTVFIGLILIIFLCKIMSAVVKSLEKHPEPVISSDTAVPANDRRAFVAAVSAAIAEDMGTCPSAIRITKITRI